MRITSQRGLAVVTGAAGGLGSAFANKLAEQGYRLLLVDRRQAQLEQACEAIADRYGASAEPYAIDLCNREEVERLARRLEQSDVELLINNAGFGTVDYFADTDPAYLIGMVDVHVVAPTMFTRAVLPRMLERNAGGIINVSSVGAWFHSAGNVVYGSTKCYLAVFSESLADELRGTNVCIQALCPGFVRTGFHAAECMNAFKLRRPPAARLWMTPEAVVDFSLRRLGRRRVLAVPGLGYRLAARFAQMPVLQPLMQWITRAQRSVSPNAPVTKSAPAAAATPPQLSIAKRA